MTPDGDRVGTETTMAGARKDDRLHVILEEERSEAAAPVDLPEPWGACVSGRIWVGKLPEHARRLVEAESLPIQWLYTAATVRQLLERKP